jgi:hypothetical protein
MGGIDHQPTSNVSLRHTVPAAAALSEAQIGLWSGNNEIELLIMLTGDTVFGAGAGRLERAATFFSAGSSALKVVKSHISKVVDTLGNPDYEPFDLSLVGDIDEFIDRLIHAGLLSDTAIARQASKATRDEGYRGMFFETGGLIDDAAAKLAELATLTSSMVRGPEGTQGYFWLNVEAGRTDWRQTFLRANTALTDLTQFWTTTSVICTEAHLKGAFDLSLLNVEIPARG